jgi:hypothetical protein
VHPRPIATLAGTVLAALFLNGCSGSVQQNGAITGADTAAASSPVTAATSTATSYPVAGLNMTFAIPSDLSVEVQTSAQSSATADQIETILVDQYKAYVEALSSNGATEANYKSVTVGDALKTENAELAWWQQHGERVTGVDRIYGFTIGTPGSKLTTFSYCEDSTGLDYKNLSTGARIPNTSSAAANHTLREGQLAKGTGQLWAVYTLLTQNGAQQCMDG